MYILENARQRYLYTKLAHDNLATRSGCHKQLPSMDHSSHHKITRPVRRIRSIVLVCILHALAFQGRCQALPPCSPKAVLSLLVIISPLYVGKGEDLPAITQVIVKRSMGHMAEIDGRSRSSEGTQDFLPSEAPAENGLAIQGDRPIGLR